MMNFLTAFISEKYIKIYILGTYKCNCMLIKFEKKIWTKKKAVFNKIASIFNYSKL